MQRSMGTERIVYKLYIGKYASSSDAVDIFDYDKDLEFTNIEEQYIYYIECLKSIMG